MNKLIACVGLLFVMGGVSGFAQNTTKERQVLDCALTVLEDYEALSSVSDEEAYYSFLELFTSEDLLVYNDLLGSSSKSTLTVKEYADFQLNQAKAKQVFITDINRKRIWQEEGVWKVEYAFDKAITYLNDCEIYYSSKDFYGDVYKMTAVVRYDEEKEKCFIEKITGSVQSSAQLEEGHYTFLKTSPYDDDLKVNGEKVVVNRFNQMFLPATINDRSFSFADADVVAKPIIKEDCRTVTVGYKARRQVLKAHYDIWFGSPYSLGNTGGITESKSSASSFGIDYGYLLPSKSKVKIGLFTGLGMTMSSIDLAYTNADYNYQTRADVDGDSYIRHYENLALKQNAKMTELNVPLYADFDLRFSRIVSLYLDLGVKLNLGMSNKVGASEGSAYIYGIYPQYDNLRMDEHWGINGFGNSTFSSSNQANTKIDHLSAFNVDAFGGVGLRFFIPKTTLALDLGVNYQMGLLKSIKQDGSSVSFNGGINEDNALVYNTISGLNSEERTRNLVEGLGNVSRGGLKLNIGLLIKF